MHIVLITFATNMFAFSSKTTLRVFDLDNLDYMMDCINDQLEDITTPEMNGIRCTQILHIEEIPPPIKPPRTRSCR